MRVVYLDVVWLTNLVMDSLILFATGWMARSKVGRWRILLGAVLGASYSLLLLIPAATGPAMSFLAKLLFSCLLILVTFRPKKTVEFLRYWGLFYLASFLVGGAAYGINSIFQETYVMGGMVLIAGDALWKLNIGTLFIVLSIPTVYVIGKMAWNRMERLKNRAANLWKMSLCLDDKQVELVGLLDTGNGLLDPISRLPVAVVEWEVLTSLLPEAVSKSFREHQDPTLALSDTQLEPKWQSRFRIVPYRGVGGTMGMLLAFRPSELLITQADTQIKVEKILIAINPKPLSSERSYQAILPPSCLTGDGASKAS